MYTLQLVHFTLPFTVHRHCMASCFSLCVIHFLSVGNQFNTQVASGSDNVTDMGLTTATSTLFLPDLKAPFIIVLVLSALLAIGVGIIIIIMGR